MKELTLKRVHDSIWGCFGLLMDADVFLCATLERPWEDNKPNVSRIPAGVYTCKRGVWPTFGLTFEITGVDGRFAILFHKGNFASDSMGCVILGSGFGMMNGQLALKDSGEAFSWFIKHLKDETEFKLTIKDI